MDPKLLDILACPVCKSPLLLYRPSGELVCRADRLAFPVREEMAMMVEDDARRLGSDDPALAR
jgi:uncharacterized protein YbaR (Trm112 family)